MATGRRRTLLVVPALVSADFVAAVLEAYTDRVADAAHRLGCPPQDVAAVVERSGVALIEMCARSPGQVVDLAGRWLADTRAMVLAAPTVALPTGTPSPTAAGVDVETALAELDERRRFALLLRDSYDLAPLAVAVALDSSTSDAAMVVAEARLRLLEAHDGTPAPSLAGHRVVAGVSLGTLGALSDGAAAELTEYDDPVLPARRRHVGSCAACAAVLDAQTRARVALAALAVLGLAEAERGAVLARLLERGTALLPSAERVRLAAEKPRRALPPLVAGLVLLLALVVGVAVGAASLGRGPAPPAAAPPATTTLPSDTVTATAAPTDEPSPAPSASASTSAPTIAPPTTAGVASASVAASAAPRQARRRFAAGRRSAAPPTVPPPPPVAAQAPTSPVASTAAASSAATSAAASPSSSASATAPSTAITLSPTSGPRGTTITVKGSGFQPGATVTLSYSNSTGSPGTATAGSDGTVNGSVTADDSGLVVDARHTVTATDGTRSATATFEQTT